MGRPLRLDAPGCWHHVMNRGAGRRIVFRDDDDRTLFLDLLSELDERFGVEIHAFCLMGNHYHLLVRSRSGDISEAMKWLGSRFTLEVNARRSVDGPIFRGRYHSLLVEQDAHLTWLYRYINANPLDLGWTERLASYPWSGLSAAIHERSDQAWLRVEAARARFGDDPRRLERFVESARVDHGADATLRGLDDADVASAVEVARRPGPGVSPDPHARAAHTWISNQLGLSFDSMSTISHLNETARKLYVKRATTAVQRDPGLASLVQRAESVLAITTSPPALDENHRVSDTR